VPLRSDYLSRLRPVVLATAPDGLIFTAPLGGPLLYPTWLRRVWKPALQVPVLDERGRPTKDWTPLLADPQPTPHDCRHTYGTDLADSGVEPHHRMELMGHKDARSAKRYTHSNDARFDKARDALDRARSGSSSRS